ncbi:MAG: type II toxin-antitoxin system RatA family toxin [Hyphomicrobiaceae bacterium]
MRTVETRRVMRHGAVAMFDLVADVERYPQFVPLCASLKVRERRTEGRAEVLIADMTAAYKMFHETFRSRVRLDREALAIHVDYLDGPFRHLENRWTFKALGEGRCEVDFFIRYEFRALPLQLLVGAVFDKVYGRMVEAFELRADKIYGRQPGEVARGMPAAQKT